MHSLNAHKMLKKMTIDPSPRMLCSPDYESLSCRFSMLGYTVNVDIFACINFREFTEIGNFAWT